VDDPVPNVPSPKDHVKLYGRWPPLTDALNVIVGEELFDCFVEMLTRSLLAGRFVTPHQAWYAAVSLKLSTGTAGSRRPSVMGWRVRFCADHPRLSPLHETETDPVDRFTGDEVCGDGPKVRPAKTNAPFGIAAPA